MRNYHSTLLLATALLFCTAGFASWASAESLPTENLPTENLPTENLPTEKGCAKIAQPSAIVQGWCLAITRKQGNCLACHRIVVANWPEDLADGGNIAPPLVAMQARFPDKTSLHAQIYDATASNPQSMMPPFGAHGILSKQEIDKIVTFLLTI